MEEFTKTILQNLTKSLLLIVTAAFYGGYMLTHGITYTSSARETAVHIAITVMLIIAGFVVRYIVLDDLKEETTSK